MNHMLLLIRREFWEHRALLIAPAIVAVILVAIALWGGGQLRGLEQELRHVPPEYASWAPSVILFGISVAFAIVMSIVTAFYLLDSLYSERKDRSIFFWKSLPLSDRSTVLSKLVTAAVVIPLLTYVAAFATGLLVAFISSVHLSIAGVDGAWGYIWSPRAWVATEGLLLYTAVAAILWQLPIFAWFLLASAWARKTVFLWAILPPVLVMIAESTFGTHYFARLVGDRLQGWHVAYDAAGMDTLMTALHADRIPENLTLSDLVDPIAYFASPGLWLGLLVAAGFIWGAVELRRRRTEV